MSITLFNRWSSQQGFSLVEMMVAITIGLLLLAGLGTVYLGSTQTFRQQEALARMQEGARYAFEVMTLDIRQAGYTGCAPRNQTFSTLNVSTPPDWYNNLGMLPLMGFESGAGLPAAVTGALANTDAVGILRADDSGNFRVQNHNGTSATIGLGVHSLQQGEILTAVPPDCSMAATFQMTNVNNNSTTTQVVHNNGNAVTPGNSTECLGDPGPPPTAPCAAPTPATNPDLPPNSKIMRMRGTIYFLANNTNAPSQPSLFREILSTSGGNAVSIAEELIEGVENMQILYGEDTSAPIDQNVDQYVTADAVTNWDNVFAVRVSLLMRSVENSVVNQPQEVMFNGATVNSGVGADRRLRKVFTTTIAVRNRL